MVRITTGRFKTAFTAAERPLTKSVYKALQAPIYEEQAPQKKETTWRIRKIEQGCNDF